MPRDGSGAYSLPVGNPVVTGTLIESNWANSTLSDIAVQLNNVLTRDGVLGPISPFKIVDGAVATPGLAFNSEPGLGWFRSAANVISLATVNAYIASFNGSVSTAVSLSLFPRSAGGTKLVLNSDVQGAANTTQLHIGQDQTQATIESVGVGTGLPKPIVIKGLSVNFDGKVPALGGLNQCFFEKNGTLVQITPYKGNKIAINGKLFTLPAAGIQKAAAGLGASTHYYAYVFETGTPGVLDLELSVTGFAYDTTYGQAIKAGDPTRTLVGRLATTAASAFADSPTQRLVSSWPNREPQSLFFSNAVAFSPNPTGAMQRVNTFELLEWVGWGDEVITVGSSLPIQHTTTNGVISTGVALDSVSVVNLPSPDTWQAYGGNANGSAKYGFPVTAAAGYHYLCLMGTTNLAQATYRVGGTFFATLTPAS